MSRRALVLLAVPVLLLSSSCSGAEQVSTRLHSTDTSRVVGVAVLRAVDGGTLAIVNVSDLPHGARLRGAVNAGTCPQPGASILALPDVEPGEVGRARVSGRLRFRGDEDVALRDVADGEHVVRLYGEDGDVACGRIPAL